MGGNPTPDGGGAQVARAAARAQGGFAAAAFGVRQLPSVPGSVDDPATTKRAAAKGKDGEDPDDLDRLLEEIDDIEAADPEIAGARRRTIGQDKATTAGGGGGGADGDGGGRGRGDGGQGVEVERHGGGSSR